MNRFFGESILKHNYNSSSVNTNLESFTIGQMTPTWLEL